MAECRRSFDEEYDALRSGRGFVELLGWSLLRIGGADCQTFLHNFCTNDVKRLRPSEACETFFTNVKGKIVGHGLLMNTQPDAYELIGPPGQSLPLI